MTIAGGGIGGIDIGGGGGPDGNKCDGGGCYRKGKFYFLDPSNINIQSKEEVVDHLFQVVEEDQKMVAMLVETLAVVVVVAVNEKDLVVAEVLIEEKLNEQNKNEEVILNIFTSFFSLNTKCIVMLIVATAKKSKLGIIFMFLSCCCFKFWSIAYDCK
jgi:hypothetical protein